MPRWMTHHSLPYPQHASSMLAGAGVVQILFATSTSCLVIPADTALLTALRAMLGTQLTLLDALVHWHVTRQLSLVRKPTTWRRVSPRAAPTAASTAGPAEAQGKVLQPAPARKRPRSSAASKLPPGRRHTKLMRIEGRMYRVVGSGKGRSLQRQPGSARKVAVAAAAKVSISTEYITCQHQPACCLAVLLFPAGHPFCADDGALYRRRDARVCIPP